MKLTPRPKHDTQDLLDFIFRHGKRQMYVDAKGYWLDIAPEANRTKYVNISNWTRKELLELARAIGYRG